MSTSNIYNYALAPTSQFYFCGMPLRLDTTPKCNLNCLYCFAMSRGGRRTSSQLTANPDTIARKLSISLDESKQKDDVIGELLSKKTPIHFGGISDPFSNDSISKLSKKLLLHLDSFDYPVLISTKNSNILLEEETMNILTSMKNVAVQISFSSLNSETCSIIEPNVPPPSERIDCINELTQEGIHVIARLQPLFPGTETEVCQELIPKIGEAGCRHIIIEYLKLPVEKNLSLANEMFTNLNWNGYEFYQKNHAELIGREWVLPKEFIWQHIQPVIKCIHDFRMTYGSGDYGLNHLGDTNCCCGVDNIPGFDNWYKGNFSNLIKNSINSNITVDQLSKYWFPKGSIKRYMNSNCRLKSINDIYSYLIDKWNNPSSTNAPNNYLGVSWNGDKDYSGNCIYIKKENLG